MIKNIKKKLCEENKNKLIILLTTLVFIWLIYFLFPSVFVLLFTTFLGKTI